MKQENVVATTWAMNIVRGGIYGALVGKYDGSDLGRQTFM